MLYPLRYDSRDVERGDREHLQLGMKEKIGIKRSNKGVKMSLNLNQLNRGMPDCTTVTPISIDLSLDVLTLK